MTEPSISTERPDPPDRGHLLTEQRNARSTDLDALGTLGCLRLINSEDQHVARAIEARIEQITTFTDLVIQSLRQGGRLIYLGAGTSGRLGVLDASECPPTFQSDPGQVVGIIAGGDSALRVSSEHREDEPEGAHEELTTLGLNAQDTVLGIAAGGTTPYVLGGVAFAKQIGCSTGLLTCTPIQRPAWCDVLMAIETGPEVLTGSTRMKAGSATKMVLNMISTGAMVGMGKTYSNMMVDLRASNDKLLDRAARIITEICGGSRQSALELLDRANNSVKHAIVMQRKQIGFDEADALLRTSNGHLSAIIGGAP